MAVNEATVAVTLIAAEALAIGQTIEIDSSGEAAIPGAATDVIVGVAGETVAIGDSVPVVQLTGIVKMIAVGAITAGEVIVPIGTVGRVDGVAGLAALAADQMGIGIALESPAAAGQVFAVLALSVAAPHSA